jgi:hypothetical protein
LQFRSLKDLDWTTKNFKSEAGLAKQYKEMIRLYPGTDAAKEARRRLAGDPPTYLAVPAKPVPPVRPVPPMPVPRTPPQYDPEPVIPDVPTLADLRERRFAAERQRKADQEAETKRKAAAAEADAARKAEEEFEVNGLVLLRKTLNGVNNQFSMEITGTVVNRRGKTLNYAQITFNIYNESGAQVGSAIANINGLEPGGRWDFKAVGFTTSGTKYKVSKLSGF